MVEVGISVYIRLWLLKAANIKFDVFIDQKQEGTKKGWRGATTSINVEQWYCSAIQDCHGACIAPKQCKEIVSCMCCSDTEALIPRQDKV